VHVHSFAPIVDHSSRVLVLGSMPGKASLRAGQYYAHPRNLFWQFMHELLSVDAEASYEQRTAGLLERGVALWDVLKSCTRESSLDSDIVTSSIVANDFHGLFREYPQIRVVCFNGAKAADVFSRNVLGRLGERAGRMRLHRLPSTSPANASVPFARKLDAWRAVATAD